MGILGIGNKGKKKAVKNVEKKPDETAKETPKEESKKGCFSKNVIYKRKMYYKGDKIPAGYDGTTK